MADMTKSKEELAWRYAAEVLNRYSEKHGLARTVASDAIALITEQIERLMREADNG